jgi:uncharacterized protein (TIGR03437 family)
VAALQEFLRFVELQMLETKTPAPGLIMNLFFRISAALLTLSCLPVVATGTQLWLGSTNLSPGSSGSVIISLTSGGDPVSGLQFDLVFDGPALSLNPVAGTALRSAGKNIYYSVVSPTTYRLLISGLNESSVPDGPVFTVFVNVSPSAAPNTYNVSVTHAVAVDPAGNAISVADVSGAVTVSGQTGDFGALQSNGILSAGSLLAGAVAPGELIAVVGSSIGPETPATLQVDSNKVSTTLANVQVKFDGVPAPLTYAGLNQINAVVPYEVAGQMSTQITVERSGQTAGPIALPVADSAPAIFTQNAGGIGQASAINEDGTLNTPRNLAPAGTIVALFLTGTGQATPAQITGALNGPADVGKTILEVTATIAGSPAEVRYAGPAPGLIAGATQINLKIPDGITPSYAAPVSIKVGDATTQDDVFISVGPAKP